MYQTLLGPTHTTRSRQPMSSLSEDWRNRIRGVPGESSMRVGILLYINTHTPIKVDDLTQDQQTRPCHDEKDFFQDIRLTFLQLSHNVDISPCYRKEKFLLPCILHCRESYRSKRFAAPHMHGMLRKNKTTSPF
jgi:hypothetical protein